jgi:hypothetical protein
MCHETMFTEQMLVEALARSYRANPAEPSINAVLAELQAERERTCPCNSPEMQRRRQAKIAAVLAAKQAWLERRRARTS